MNNSCERHQARELHAKRWLIEKLEKAAYENHQAQVALLLVRLFDWKNKSQNQPPITVEEVRDIISFVHLELEANPNLHAPLF